MEYFMLPDYMKIKDIKPALSGYIGESLALLNPDIEPGEKVVHDIRVFMKKSRAVMKLLKNQIEESTFEREYKTFREAGRKMREWRETSVLRKILKLLRKKHPDIFTRLKEVEKINLLIGKPGLVAGLTPETGESLEYIIDLLRKSGYRLRFLNLNNLDPHLLLKELEITYETVIHCFVTARNIMKPSNLHEFRKKTKDFVYQLYFFRSLNPGVVKDVEKRINSIGQNLGRYNDLAVLVKTIGYNYGKNGITNPALDELILVIRDEQDKYLSKVWPEAYKIFCPGQKLTNLLGYKILTI